MNNWLILSLGSNLGDKLKNLNLAKVELKKILNFKGESRVYTSRAVDYLEQPDFFNQSIEFELPNFSPDTLMTKLRLIETKLGRKKTINKGPRVIDLDIIFWGDKLIKSELVKIPHPSWKERSFVVYPLKDLPSFQEIKFCFKMPTQLNNEAFPI